MTPEHRAVPFLRLLALACLGAFVFLVMGCLPKEEPQTSEYGPQVPTAEISAALQKALENVDDTRMEVGEFVHRAYSQRLAEGNGPASVTSDVGQTVTEREELIDRVVYKIVEHEVTYKGDGTYSKVSREGPYVAFKGATDSVSTNASLRTFAAPHEVVGSLIKALSTQITYHQLRYSEEEVDPPKKVREKPGCEGLPNCRIKIRRLGYDAVLWGDGEPERLRRDFVFSSDVPFLATQLESCDTGLVPIGESGMKVLVKACATIENFQFKEQSP